jgi:hypothetical protein
MNGWLPVYISEEKTDFLQIQIPCSNQSTKIFDAFGVIGTATSLYSAEQIH